MNLAQLNSATQAAEDAQNFLKQTKDVFLSLTENLKKIEDDHDYVIKTLEDLIERMETVFEELDDIERDSDDLDDDTEILYSKKFTDVENDLDEAVALSRELAENLKNIINELEDISHSTTEDDKYKAVNRFLMKSTAAIKETEKHYNSIII